MFFRLFCAIAIQFPVLAQSLSLNPNQSTFSVVTNRSGIAAKLAHHHLIVATNPQVSFTGTLDNLASLEMTFEVDAKSLEVDSASQQKAHQERLMQLGALPSPFSEVGESDKEKIKSNMLAKGQLAADSFPKIEARLFRVQAKPQTIGGVKFTHAGDLSVTIRGKTVNKLTPLILDIQEKSVNVESMIGFKFSEFEIEPFSALLGAIKNADQFYIYVNSNILIKKG